MLASKLSKTLLQVDSVTIFTSTSLSLSHKRKPNTTMAEQLATPRITAAYLDNFVGRVVMLVGKVTQLRGDQATLDSEGTVTVLLNRVSHSDWCLFTRTYAHD